ncbi:hypothetical protein DPH57_08865 [Massilia sp. YMA4]|nr:hypothetical protein DPH57_08865 [Massilia sp. YMA4]
MQAILLVLGVMLPPGAAIAAAPQEAKTVTITRDNPAAKTLLEPTAKTQEDLEKLGPLDWTKTIGTPRRVEPTAEESKALANAKPQMSEGGPPDQEAEEAARSQELPEAPPRERQ